MHKTGRLFWTLWILFFSVQAHAIFNGWLSEPGSLFNRSAVALVDNKGETFCSGVLIDQHIVLTAAHCVVKGSVANADFTLQFGAGKETRPAQEVFFNQRYKENNCDSTKSACFDIAMITFKDELPEAFRPAVLNENPDLVRRGDVFWSAGQGLNNKQGVAHLGVLIWTRLKVVDPKQNGGTLIESLGDSTGICKGDSGGPAYLVDKETGKLILFGINVWKRSFNKLCGERVGVIHLAKFNKWISTTRQTIALHRIKQHMLAKVD